MNNFISVDESKTYILKSFIEKINCGGLDEQFTFKNLNVSHTSIICEFLNNNYTTETENIRKIFTFDSIYWYLRQSDQCIGLIHQEILIGILITQPQILLKKDKPINTTVVNILCINKKLRRCALATHLLTNLYTRDKNHTYLIQLNKNTEPPLFPVAEIELHYIPVNYKKLLETGFLQEKIAPHQKPVVNDLYNIKINDLPSIVKKINSHQKKYSVQTVFLEENAKSLFMSKKNIVFSFVKRDNSGKVTDFINLTKELLYREKKEGHRKSKEISERKNIVSCGFIRYYFCETLTLTDLILCLIEKISKHEIYDIDQLILYNTADKATINVVKFVASTTYCLYTNNINLPKKKEHFDMYQHYEIFI